MRYTSSGPVTTVTETSNKLQASSSKLLKKRVASVKPQAPSFKLQAPSIKRLDPGPWKKFHAPLTEVLD